MTDVLCRRRIDNGSDVFALPHKIHSIPQFKTRIFKTCISATALFARGESSAVEEMTSSAQILMAQAYGARLLTLSKGMLHDIYINPNLADDLWNDGSSFLCYILLRRLHFNFHIKPAHAIIADRKMHMAPEFVLQHCKCATH